jgi:hypothetical protein
MFVIVVRSPEQRFYSIASRPPGILIGRNGTTEAEEKLPEEQGGCNTMLHRPPMHRRF